MKPRIKKLIGFAVLLPLVGLYFIAAAALSERLPDVNLLKALYFLVAGVVWAFPVKYLLMWMNADPEGAVPKQDNKPPFG